MAETNNIGRSEHIVVRFLLLVVAAATAFIFTLILGFTYPLPNIFAGFEFYSTSLVASILLQLAYRRPKWIYLVVGVGLIGWYVVLVYTIPAVAERELMRVAKAEVPVYPNAELVDVSYHQAHGVQGAGVTFTYHSENPEQEFRLVKEYFKETLTPPRWESKEFNFSDPLAHLNTPLDSLVFRSEGKLAGNRFWTGVFEGKGVELLPSRIHVNYKSDTENPIQVYVTF